MSDELEITVGSSGEGWQPGEYFEIYRPRGMPPFRALDPDGSRGTYRILKASQPEDGKQRLTVQQIA